MDCLLDYCHYKYRYVMTLQVNALETSPSPAPPRTASMPPRTNPTATGVTACFSPWQFSLLISSLDVSLFFNFLLIGG